MPVYFVPSYIGTPFIFGTIISIAQIYFDYKKQDDELANNITETVRFVNESLGKAIFEIDDAFVVDGGWSTNKIFNFM